VLQAGRRAQDSFQLVPADALFLEQGGVTQDQAERRPKFVGRDGDEIRLEPVQSPNFR
jgi:hypothetical protein